MNGKKLGFALCGSFCTLERTLKTMAELAAAGWEIQPIMSPITYETDTRFGAAEQWRDRVEGLCGRPIWHTVPQVEPIGPRKLLDILLVAPCTGNTLGKLANGITDTPVTMAVKAHLRGDRPVVLAVSTNDGLSGSAAGLGALLCRKNYYFVPFGQDDPLKKPTSLCAELSLTGATLEAALRGEQLQPLLLGARVLTGTDEAPGTWNLAPGHRCLCANRSAALRFLARNGGTRPIEEVEPPMRPAQPMPDGEKARLLCGFGCQLEADDALDALLALERAGMEGDAALHEVVQRQTQAYVERLMRVQG